MDLEIISAISGMNASGVWDKLRASHPELFGDEAKCNFDELNFSERDFCERDLNADTKCSVAQASRAIAQGLAHFGVKLQDTAFDFCPIRNAGHSLLIVSGGISSYTDAIRWCGPFLEEESFRHARIYDPVYDHWQNAQYPLEYTAVGRPYKHLPMKSNGIPPPLEQMIVDTSRNPGRRIIRRGYVEAVGSLMWLGRSFWQLTGANYEQVRTEPRLKCSELPGGVLQIQASETPFVVAEGREGYLQEQLRALLFPMAIKLET